MSRVLLDVNFNDQTTGNHALNSDWKESPTLNIAMSNYDFVELESGNYCLHNSDAGNNYNHRGYSYVGSKFRDIDDYEIEFDGWYITVLNWKNPEFNGEYAGFNQSMILKINNMYKSVIFMGNSANQAGEFFKDNHLDELKCDAVQVSNNGSQFVNNEIYQKMKPKYLLISVPVNTNQVETQNYGNELKNILNSKEVHFSNEGDKSLVIW